MADIHVFTSIAANYLPKAKALFASIATLHPEWQCHLLLVEDLAPDEAEALAAPYPVVQLRDLGIPDWRPWAFCHNLVELCTAAKPFMLRRLLARQDCQAVLYFDPDILLFTRLDDAIIELEAHSILLTPHQTAPETSLDGVMGNEITSLRYGSYNLGFLGVARDAVGSQFSDWWCERLYRFCRDDPARGLFTDQRWADLVPSLFDRVGILRNPRMNVAAWNWNSRDLSVTPEGRFRCGEAPLGFYHFTGIDSGNHELMLEKFPAQRAVIAALLAHYRESLDRESLVLSDRQPNGAGWTFACLEDETLIEAAWRCRYRDVPALQARFPDPWVITAGEWRSAMDTTASPTPAYLSAGYQGGKSGWDIGRAMEHLRTAVLQPTLGRKMWSHARQIVREEGFAGLRRRLSKTATGVGADEPTIKE